MDVVTKDGVHYPFPVESTIDGDHGDWLRIYGAKEELLAIFLSSQVVAVILTKGETK